jgi:hypothetical protein
MATLIPIDFNSLSRVEDGRIALTNYYMDHAFYSEGINPADGMDITFYDEDRLPNSTNIICLDARLQKNATAPEPWSAELKGRIYTSTRKATRKYFSSFIGAETRRLADNGGQTLEQKIGNNPPKNKLSGIS